jgi:ABC-type branched-subunit amino acid transport system ATPase component
LPEPILLSLRDLSSGYGSGLVLQGLSLSLHSGERVGMLGRNGAGKTTLMRTVMGLLNTHSGNVLVDGRRLTGLPTHEVARSGVAYVPQGRELFVHQTLEQNLRVGGFSRGGVDLSEIWRLFGWMRERRHERAGNLSGGQQQQLALARALMSQPRLLLLDEPFEGVQPSVVQDMIETLTSVCAERGIALLLAEQKVESVLALCERVVIIERGKLSVDVSREVLQTSPGMLDEYLGV